MAGDLGALTVADTAGTNGGTVLERAASHRAGRIFRGNLLGQTTLHRTETGDRRDAHGDVTGPGAAGSGRNRTKTNLCEPLLLWVACRHTYSAGSVRFEANHLCRLRQSIARRSAARHPGKPANRVVG